MSSSSAAERRTPRRAAALTLALAVLLAGCSGVSDPGVQSAPASPSGPAVGRQDPADIGRRLSEALHRRAQAVLRHDETGFEAGLGGGADFAAAQQQYWDNLAQLPVTAFEYRPDLRTLVHRGPRLDLVVDLHLTLGEYDDHAALSRWSMSFRDSGRGLRLVGAVPGTAQDSGGAQPWDLGPVEVRQTGGALLVLDPGARAAAGDLARSVSAGIADVEPRVPRGWTGRVVVYAPETLRFMDSLAHVPGGDPASVDALTYTVPGVRASEPAALRIALNPAWVQQPGTDRDRLLRHELTHVAMGPLGDAVPSWMAEGIAEYVSVQSVPVSQRGLASDALAEARLGLTSLPGEDGFDGNRSAANYGLAWWACETIARSWGDAVLWSLLDAYDRAESPDGVLLRTLGVGEPRLARDTAKLIRQQYAVR